jgi:hypothetical protein
LISTGLGITNFKNLQINTSYTYKIYKGGYNDLSGSLFLSGDTTVTLSMEPYSTVITEKSELKNINIWPNPVSETLNITIPAGFAGGSIEILNLQGTSLKTFYPKHQEIFALSVKEIPSGIYLVKLISQKNYFIQRFVKE